MAARKKKDEVQASLFAMAFAPRVVAPEPEPASDLDELDLEPDVDLKHRFVAPPGQAPTANLVEPPAPPVRDQPTSTNPVEVLLHISGQFLVTRMRDNGTTSSGTFYTRAELELLVARATEALR